MMELLSDLFDTVLSFEVYDGLVAADFALLLVRVVLAVIFLVSFQKKYKDIAGFAKQNNLPLVGGYFQVGIEGFAGASLLLGGLTQLGALAAMAAMAGSMFFHIVIWHSKYWAAKGGWEYDLMIFAMSAAVFVTGGGLIGLYPLPAMGWLPFL